MSKIHVLSADTNGNYQIVIHTNTPAGNNSAGISWVTAGLNAGLLGISVMAVGTGAGQITTAEKANVTAGTVIEIVINIPAESGGATSASLDNMVNQIITQRINDLAKQLKYFGYTQ